MAAWQDSKRLSGSLAKHWVSQSLTHGDLRWGVAGLLGRGPTAGGRPQASDRPAGSLRRRQPGDPRDIVCGEFRARSLTRPVAARLEGSRATESEGHGDLLGDLRH